MGERIDSEYIETVISSQRLLTQIVNLLADQDEQVRRIYADSRRDLEQLEDNNRNGMYYNRARTRRFSDMRNNYDNYDNLNTAYYSNINANTNTNNRSANNNDNYDRAYSRHLATPVTTRTEIRQRRVVPVSRRRTRDGEPITETNSSVNLANLLATALMSEVGGNLSPVVVRPSDRVITQATETIPYSTLPGNDLVPACPISHETFSETSAVMRIRACGHYFTPESLRTWFASSVRCPICRHDIRTDLPNEHHVMNDHDSEDEAEDEVSVAGTGQDGNLAESSPQPTSTDTTMNDEAQGEEHTFITGGNPMLEIMNALRRDMEASGSVDPSTLTYSIDVVPYTMSPDLSGSSHDESNSGSN